MKKYGLFIFIFSYFFLNTWALQAQRLRKTRALRSRSATEGYVSVGFQLNAMNYVGDIPSDITFTRPGLSIFLERKLGPRTQARLSYTWGRILGDDFSASEESGTYARNLHFRNDIQELALLLTYDLVPSFGKYGRRALFTPYFIGGIALFHHNPQAKIPVEQGNDWVSLQPLGTEGQGRPGYDDPYGKIQFAVPLGLGFRFALTERLDFGIESAVRFTFFDYLDDVSNEYPELDELGNPLVAALANRTLEEVAARAGEPRDLEAAIARFGQETYVGFDGQTYRTLGSFRRGQSTRGNPNTKDIYIVTGFHLKYIINVGLKCPDFYNR